ncbi:aspartate kinase [Methylosinus sp. H3A]|uniref:aspartate kinase n=1 Tax=Methylosinus sp. H3A TaxID=2785786 RepID=UPI0018C3145E|nr:aspartate kinase [Methylosinus sp. H3A]MBG0809112.1 aspartate kinase [Methylosinus sp. H3A]
MPSPRAEARPKADARHLVAKLGGSLSASPVLRQWLAALLRYAGPLTIVPGGGPFADAVRRAQETLRFSDEAAHEMAIMAMEQYGRALCDLEPQLVPVSTPQEAEAAHRRGAAAIWRPVAMTRAAPQIPQSWEMTSDSLAAWYAREAGASALLLIKSVDFLPQRAFPPPPGGGRSSAEGDREGVTPRVSGLTPPRTVSRSDPPPDGEGSDAPPKQPIVDPCFAHHARGLDVFIAGPAALREADESLARGAIPGASFDFTREQSIAS